MTIIVPPLSREGPGEPDQERTRVSHLRRGDHSGIPLNRTKGRLTD
jgi:hypothetical protein